jgi:hypothetical protein
MKVRDPDGLVIQINRHEEELHVPPPAGCTPRSPPHPRRPPGGRCRPAVAPMGAGRPLRAGCHRLPRRPG